MISSLEMSFPYNIQYQRICSDATLSRPFDVYAPGDWRKVGCATRSIFPWYRSTRGLSKGKLSMGRLAFIVAKERDMLVTAVFVAESTQCFNTPFPLQLQPRPISVPLNTKFRYMTVLYPHHLRGVNVR